MLLVLPNEYIFIVFYHLSIVILGGVKNTLAFISDRFLINQVLLILFVFILNYWWYTILNIYNLQILLVFIKFSNGVINVDSNCQTSYFLMLRSTTVSKFNAKNFYVTKIKNINILNLHRISTSQKIKIKKLNI